MTKVYVFYKSSFFNTNLLGNINLLYDGLDFEWIDIDEEPKKIHSIAKMNLGKTLIVSPSNAEIYAGLVQQIWEPKKEKFRTIIVFTGLSEESIVSVINKFNIYPFHFQEINLYALDILFEVHFIHTMTNLYHHVGYHEEKQSKTTLNVEDLELE